MKRQVFTVNNIRLWGVFETENVVLLNVAGTRVTAQQIKATGKLATPQETLDVYDAEDPYTPKHVNHGKFANVYLKRGIAPRSSQEPSRRQTSKRRSVEIN